MDVHNLFGIPNLDIILMGLVAIGDGTLGLVAYLNNRKSITNISFLLAAASVIAWGMLNLIMFRLTDPMAIIWTLRAAVFFAVVHAFYAFQLFYVFPEEKIAFPRWYRYALIPFTAIVALTTLTPLVFIAVVGFSAGAVAEVANGPAIALFGLTTFALPAAGLGLFLRKIFLAQKELRVPYLFIFTGATITYTLIIVFNFVFPALLNHAELAPLAGLFTFPYIILTAYAIIKHRLLQVKVIATEFLSAALSGVTLLEIVMATSVTQLVFRVAIFILVLVFSYLLIGSVVREVQQREKIQQLADELAETNERQEVLMRFVTHEVKGYLTKDQSAFAAILEGDFCPVPGTLQPFLVSALAQTRAGAESVMNILKASNLKKGTTTFLVAPFDLAAVATDAVEKEKPSAAQKKLALSYTCDAAGAPYTFTGDQKEIGEHVFRNLIENSINYTPTGSIDVTLKKESGKILFAVKDTGVGITDEDKKRLFTEGGHGKNSQSINVHSTGYGLFIAKSIVEAHKGTIRAESEGEGKGSTFIVEFPQ